ncbi:pentapeptide repeat-containing protein, partial [Pseudomonas putida]
MNYLPLALLIVLAPAMAENADDVGNDPPLTINGCVIAEASQCPGADLRGANLANQDLRKMNLAGADLRDADLPPCPA